MPESTTRKTIERKTTDRDLVLIKLTDLQRTVLAGATQRDDRAATLPERMTEKAAEKLAATLIEKRFAREVRPRPTCQCGGAMRRDGPAHWSSASSAAKRSQVFAIVKRMMSMLRLHRHPQLRMRHPLKLRRLLDPNWRSSTHENTCRR
jgi:hypothetical protein